jgi:AcrR family transcriptional regulator
MARRPTAARTRPAGRRPGAPDTRGAIIDAARAEFAARGFDATSMRAVARAADVDPALVHHYFDSKDELFQAVLDLPFSPRDEIRSALDVPRDRLGAAVIGLVLKIWDDPERQPTLLALIRSSTTTQSATDLLRDGLLRTLLREIAAASGITEPEERLPFVATQTIGLIFARYVLRIEPLAGLPADAVVARIGPVIQHYLTGKLGQPEVELPPGRR